jgi:hypothetical protein
VLQVLFQNVTEFEEKIGTRVGDDVDVMKTALAFVEGGVTMPKDIILNRPTSRRVIDVLCLYRLVDVLHALHGRIAFEGNPRYSKLQIPEPNDKRVSIKLKRTSHD